VTAGEAIKFRAALWHKQVASLLRDAMPSEGSAQTAGQAGLPEEGLQLEVPVFRVATRVGQLPNVRSALREAQKGLPRDRLPLAGVPGEPFPRQICTKRHFFQTG